MFDDSDCNFCNIELGKDPVLKDLHSDREYIYIYIYRLVYSVCMCMCLCVEGTTELPEGTALP